ncbi:MAG: ATP-binding cassette domain-containing protein [Anaerolineales bacterium]|nr:ATP-binding cassette domain-containing protein [Anaerolineales bacterium]
MQLDSAPFPLVVENLSCRYETREELALGDISFEVEAGQIVLIAGTSGSGKTTLLRCINGLIPRSYKAELSGRVLLDGQDFSDEPLTQISQIVGTVLQDPERQILGAYVRNEVAFGLENLGIPRDEIINRIQDTLTHLGISHLQDKQTFNLSGGEKQKVALAGVMVMQPSILALDEPLANLDPTSAREALALIRRLADEGKTVLVIEHRVEDVLSLDPDLVMLMEGGRVTYMGSAEGVLQTADYRAVKLPAPVVIDRALNADPVMAQAQPPPADSEAKALVEFEAVSFNYPGGPEVIKDVSLAIRQGDIIALLGPNGAGKTTLVKHAIGLLKPVKGRVLLGGKDSKEMTIAEMAHNVGYVFQSPRHMLFAPSVRDELAFGPRNLRFGEEEIEENIEQALTVVGLLEETGRAPLALSFGQQKRVTIASVLAMRSQILVMDEPTAGQDYANYMNFMDSVVGLRGDDGKAYSFAAIVFITHDLDLAVTHANRILLMSDGRIVSDGPPQEVLADFDSLKRSRIIPTSLLKANLEHLDKTGAFMRAEALAQALRA